MRVLRALMLIIAAVWEMSRWVFELAGDSSMRLKKEPESPKGEGDLRQEFGDRLPEAVYVVFRTGVAYHRRKLYKEALGEYKKLRRIPLQDGGFYDLWVHSEVFCYNWRLLSKAMKPTE